jgi:membrane fusion protein (multidrug efflux system)
MRMRSRLWSSSLHVVLAAACVSGAAVLGGCSGKQAGAGAGGGGFSRPPMPVEAATVVEQTVQDRFEAVGTVDAGDAITVVSEIAGIVVSLPFQEGQRIERGGLIAQIDDVQAKAEVERAQALRDQRQSTYERVQSVVSQNAGTPQDLDDAAAALKVAEADLALAQSRLDKTRITAPFAGIAGSRAVSPGAFVRAGEEITTLAKIEEVRIIFSVPERHLARLHRGAAVTITTTAFPGYALQGRIDVIEPILDASTRTARVIAVAKNPDGKLRPGMSANVVVVLSSRENALTIPSEAVFVEGDQSLVYVINPDSTVARTALSLGTRLADAVEVLDGLKAGDRVVRTGHQKLFPGAKVMPVMGGENAPAGGAPAPAAAAADSAQGSSAR